MAAETSGGRIGRTIYMDPDTWDKLQRIVDGRESHPAVTGQTRRSNSSVLEALLKWDAPKAFEEQKKKQEQLERRLQEAKTVKWAAARNQQLMTQLERQVHNALGEVKTALDELAKLDL